MHKKYHAFFIDELLRNGTTSALILGSVHKQSVNAIFQAAQEKNMRMIAGKVMMDRNCPDYLRDTPESSYDDSKALIEQWHNKDRLLYAVTRFPVRRLSLCLINLSLSLLQKRVIT